MAKRPNILKLATKISLESMTYTGITYNDPEYKILEPIIDDEMCAIMMHLRLEANRTVEDVAKRAKQSVEYTQTQLDKLAKTGAVRYRYVDGKRCYFYPIWVPGIMEGILANREQCDKYPVLGESFEAYTRRRPEMLAPMLDSGKTGMFFMRVMPVMSAIENDTRTASYDELKTLIENATAISVGPCSCRRARRLMGEGCGHLEEDMCMYLNDNAVCYSEQGYHRLVTKEEAYEILRRAEDNGLVHEINQTPGFEDATAICNCCGCSCFALRIEELFRTPRAIRSNYIARVDKEKCVACGQCVENCQTNALKLGQKRCTTDPHISDTYDTDASVPYDRRSYDPEFRTNRSDVMPSGTAPCKAVCPLNIPVQGCLQLLSAAHPAGHAVPGAVRQRVRPPVRKGLHPQPDRHRRRHCRRVQNARPARAGRRQGHFAAVEKPVRHPPYGKDRRHRRRPRRTELRLFPPAAGLPRDRAGKGHGARRRTGNAHPVVPARPQGL